MQIRAGLAPMAGFTDVPFRVICTEYGASYTETEMISSVAVCYGDARTMELSRISASEAPCAVQIFGHDPVIMAEAASRLLDSYDGTVKPCAIDINMGCPVRKIVTPGDGSALMRDATTSETIVRAVSDVTRRHDVKLWIKIRAGWSRESINAPDFAVRMAAAGAEQITVHGRTRDMMYAPSSDNGVIRAVREAVPRDVAVIGNGDIMSASDAFRMVAETGCDGVAVGRAALGNPWIFSDIASGESSVQYRSVSERIDCALRLTRDVIAMNGEERGIRESRGRAAHFIRSIPHSAAFRNRLNHAVTYREFEEILNTLKERNC